MEPKEALAFEKGYIPRPKKIKPDPAEEALKFEIQHPLPSGDRSGESPDKEALGWEKRRHEEGK